MELKPIKYKRAYENIIANKIIVWLWANIFKECFVILKSNTLYNDDSVIRQALQNGSIYYQDGAFYSKTGRFSNAVSKELENIGAKYSSYRKAFLLEKSKVPVEILWQIDTLKAQAAQKVAALQTFLTYQLGELGKEEKKLVFDTAVESIMQDLQDRVYKNAKAKKIELITPKLTEFRKNIIAQKYTENLEFWIKNWTGEEIVSMRNVVGQMVNEGKSLITIREYIAKEFGISQRHAKFLARNESAIATTSYLQAKYMEEGFTHYKWITNIDGRERPLHKELNGHIFRFDEPPIIDDRTGQKGNPGETYNCRCTFTPVINKEWLENRRKLFKAQNSLIGKIKGFFNA